MPQCCAPIVADDGVECSNGPRAREDTLVLDRGDVSAFKSA
jgi:hypothetical protein